ncbi:MAG TPA: hypothetical protein VK654_10405 [Nitrospirota bacterium]|nr:hypothetical protein [Nitrospirota bacterium]
MTYLHRTLAAALGAVVMMSVFGCVLGKRLETFPAAPEDIHGTYTLYLYGCRYSADVKNAAFLINGDAKYPFDIFDLGTSYKAIKYISAAKALQDAQTFLHCSSRRVTGTGFRRIADDSGGTLGYELRPLYFALEFGAPDILTFSYVLKNGVVTVYVDYEPGVENAIDSSGANDRGRDASHN